MPLPFDDAWQDRPLYPMRDVHGVMRCTKYARGNSSTAFVSNLGFVVCFYRSLAFSFEQSAKPLSIHFFLAIPLSFLSIRPPFKHRLGGMPRRKSFLKCRPPFKHLGGPVRAKKATHVEPSRASV